MARDPPANPPAAAPDAMDVDPAPAHDGAATRESSPAASVAENPSDIEEEPEVELEKILARKFRKGKYFYRIRWADKTQTWEPEEHLASCPNERRAFDEAEEARLKAERAKLAAQVQVERPQRNRRPAMSRDYDAVLNATTAGKESASPKVPPKVAPSSRSRAPPAQAAPVSAPAPAPAPAPKRNAAAAAAAAPATSVKPAAKARAASKPPADEQPKNYTIYIAPDSGDEDDDASDDDVERLAAYFAGNPHAAVCIECGEGPRPTPGAKRGRGRGGSVGKESTPPPSTDPLLPCIKCTALCHDRCIPASRRKSCVLKDSPDRIICTACSRGLKDVSASLLCVACDRPATDPPPPSAPTAPFPIPPERLLRCTRCRLTSHWQCTAGRAMAEYAKRVASSKPTSPGTDAGGDDDTMTVVEALAGIAENGRCEMCQVWDGDIDLILAVRHAPAPPGQPQPPPPQQQQQQDLGTAVSEPGSAPASAPTQRYEYLVKFVDRSYRDVHWVPEVWLNMIASIRLAAFTRKRLETAKVLSETEGQRAADRLTLPGPPTLSAADVIDPQYTRVDRILEINESGEYLIQWRGLLPSQATLENPNELDTEGDADLKRAIEAYHRSLEIDSVANRNARPGRAHDDRPNPKSFHGLTAQPAELRGGELMPHQVDGLNWLIGNWCARSACILADEMGLGKTVQIVTFLQYLHVHHQRFPFLVVVPNSTLDNWEREFNKWAPELHVVSSWGQAADREFILNNLILRPGAGASSRRAPSVRCHVVLASYESVMRMDDLQRVHFDCLVVDEGHRLKNDASKLFQYLCGFSIDHKILLTGTPLQNNLRELFNLMNFLDPDQFADPEALAAQYAIGPTASSKDTNGNGTDATDADKDDEGEASEKIKELHALLRPHFLRRIKTDVVLDLPAKAEILVPVRMSPLQRQLIKDIYSSNFHLLRALGESARTKKSEGKASLGSLQNILLQCRKILSHPFVMPTVEAGLPPASSPYEVHQRLVESGGKLALLARMLPKLRAGGHKVLIFCQFQTTLDILEDFLYGMQTLAPPAPATATATDGAEPSKPVMAPFRYFRLDGSTPRGMRQKYIDEFNTDPNSFVFVLSTRAGGTGINLTSADTVIIMDIDWNPTQDLQAIARAHRIGQTRPVLAYKFMTAHSAEEKMVAVGRKKLALDHVVVQSMGKVDEVPDGELFDVLRYGASEVLAGDDADGNDRSQWQYSDEEIEKLLDRAQAVAEPKAGDAAAESDAVSGTGASAAGGGFGFAKMWQTERSIKRSARSASGAPGDAAAGPDGDALVDIDSVQLGADPSGEQEWEDILNKLASAMRDQDLTLGPRKRRQVDYRDAYMNGSTEERRRSAKKPRLGASDDDSDAAPATFDASMDVDQDYVPDETYVPPSSSRRGSRDQSARTSPGVLTGDPSVRTSPSLSSLLVPLPLPPGAKPGIGASTTDSSNTSATVSVAPSPAVSMAALLRAEPTTGQRILPPPPSAPPVSLRDALHVPLARADSPLQQILAAVPSEPGSVKSQTIREVISRTGSPAPSVSPPPAPSSVPRRSSLLTSSAARASAGPAPAPAPAAVVPAFGYEPARAPSVPEPSPAVQVPPRVAMARALTTGAAPGTAASALGLADVPGSHANGAAPAVAQPSSWGPAQQQQQQKQQQQQQQQRLPPTPTARPAPAAPPRVTQPEPAQVQSQEQARLRGLRLGGAFIPLVNHVDEMRKGDPASRQSSPAPAPPGASFTAMELLNAPQPHVDPAVAAAAAAAVGPPARPPRIPSIGARTAAAFAIQTPCWVCQGQPMSQPTYHVPTECSAICDPVWVQSQLVPPTVHELHPIKVKFFHRILDYGRSTVEAARVAHAAAVSAAAAQAAAAHANPPVAEQRPKRTIVVEVDDGSGED
ncbi:hypothetical protein H9P43_003703 [Blastocladiella emersonii ATCC 22665]|nr:hypothetical protein H9P43_003703 [Blastocladiella emersonii ATCC 22665]